MKRWAFRRIWRYAASDVLLKRWHAHRHTLAQIDEFSSTQNNPVGYPEYSSNPEMRSVRGRITPTQNWLQIHNWKKYNDSFSKGGNNKFPQTNLVPCDQPTNNHYTACPVGFRFPFRYTDFSSRLRNWFYQPHDTHGYWLRRNEVYPDWCRPSHDVNIIPRTCAPT